MLGLSLLCKTSKKQQYYLTQVTEKLVAILNFFFVAYFLLRNLGVHYVSQMKPGTDIFHICAAVSDSQVKWKEIPDPLDTVSFVISIGMVGYYSEYL